MLVVLRKVLEMVMLLLNIIKQCFYREGNVCADGLANFGLTLSNFDFFWFNDIPDFIKGEKQYD